MMLRRCTVKSAGAGLIRPEGDPAAPATGHLNIVRPVALSCVFLSAEIEGSGWLQGVACRKGRSGKARPGKGR
jgi:hypothetical protein